MQILEIYIHTIHIHSYTYIYNFFHHHHHRPPPPTPPTPQGGGGYWYIHIHTYIYNFFHHHHHPPPPTTTHHHPPPPTTTHTTGGRGVHHHPPPPTPQGGGGYWGATIQTHNHGVGGGGRYLAMLAHICIGSMTWEKNWMKMDEAHHLMRLIRLETWNWIGCSEKKGMNQLTKTTSIVIVKQHEKLDEHAPSKNTNCLGRLYFNAFANATSIACLHRCSWPWQQTSMASGQPLWWH